MKTLYIVRHAKSSWEFPEMLDLHRPILKKGEKRTKLITDYLMKNKIIIDYIISSPAVRAFQTAKIFAKEMNVNKDNLIQDILLYSADTEHIYDLFFDMPKDVNSLMIVGHNPNISYFSNEFLEEKVDYMPTSSLVCVEFDTDEWSEVSVQNSKVKFYITPKMVKSKNL